MLACKPKRLVVGCTVLSTSIELPSTHPSAILEQEQGVMASGQLARQSEQAATNCQSCGTAIR